MAKQRSQRSKRDSSTTTNENDTSSSSSSGGDTDELFKMTNLSPPQFSIIVSMSLAITNTLDIYKAATKDGRTTNYCLRFFTSTTGPISTTESDVDVFCTEAELNMIQIKYQMVLLRMALSFFMIILCWGHDPLLRTWNVTYAICPILTTLATLFLFKEDFYYGEAYSLGALLVMSLASNYRNRQGPMLPEKIWEGMHNVVLFGFIILSSYLIADHLLPENLEANVVDVGGEGFSEGARALWWTMMLVDYGMFFFASVFAFFYFDELRQRIFEFFLGITLLFHAFYQLPTQRNYWVDAPLRQTLAMLSFVAVMAGAFLPSFDKFLVKK